MERLKDKIYHLMRETPQKKSHPIRLMLASAFIAACSSTSEAKMTPIKTLHSPIAREIKAHSFMEARQAWDKQNYRQAIAMMHTLMTNHQLSFGRVFEITVLSLLSNDRMNQMTGTLDDAEVIAANIQKLSGHITESDRVGLENYFLRVPRARYYTSPRSSTVNILNSERERLLKKEEILLPVIINLRTI